MYYDFLIFPIHSGFFFADSPQYLLSESQGYTKILGLGKYIHYLSTLRILIPRTCLNNFFLSDGKVIVLRII